MKKYTAILFISFLAIAGCRNDDDARDDSDFNATTVLDTEAFTPDRGTFFEGEPDMHRHLHFTMSEGAFAANHANMSIDLFVPFSQQGISGDYNMGIGEASDALASVNLLKDGQNYYISSSDYLHVTDLGNSRFRFEFVDGYGIIYQGPTVPFAGVIEGTFTFIQG